jgi:glyoxylate reductase
LPFRAWDDQLPHQYVVSRWSTKRWPGVARGIIKGAGLDVYGRLNVHPGLLALENVVLVPHMASATAETRAAMYDLVARNVVNVLNGQPPVTPIP